VVGTYVTEQCHGGTHQDRPLLCFAIQPPCGHMAKHKSSDHIRLNGSEKACTGLATADTEGARTLGGTTKE